MTNPTTTQPAWMTLTGRVCALLPCLVLAYSAAMKLQHAPEVVGMFTGKFGYPENTLGVLGALELTLTLLYAYRPTAPLGVIVLTGYLGGAVATHVRVGENFLAPIAVGVLLWTGIFLRDGRLRRWMGLGG